MEMLNHINSSAPIALCLSVQEEVSTIISKLNIQHRVLSAINVVKPSTEKII